MKEYTFRIWNKTNHPYHLEYFATCTVIVWQYSFTGCVVTETVYKELCQQRLQLDVVKLNVFLMNHYKKRSVTGHSSDVACCEISPQGHHLLRNFDLIFEGKAFMEQIHASKMYNMNKEVLTEIEESGMSSRKSNDLSIWRNMEGQNNNILLQVSPYLK